MKTVDELFTEYQQQDRACSSASEHYDAHTDRGTEIGHCDVHTDKQV